MNPNHRVHSLPPVVTVDPDRCVNCHMCISGCPVKFCNEGSGDYVNVNPDRCIGCGRCLETCTHGARLYCDDFVSFMTDLAAGEKVVAIAAPSVAANFPDRYLNLNGWLTSLGVAAVFDVGFGAELSARSYVEVLRSGHDQTLIAQPCPAVVSYIQIYQPDLIPFLAPVDSPMLHLMKMIRHHHPEFRDHRIAAISPCLAKKREFHEAGLGEYNVTFQSVDRHLQDRSIDLAAFPSEPYLNPSPERAVLFPTPGGLMRTVERWIPDAGKRTRKTEGEHSVYDYLNTLDGALKDGDDGLPLLVDCLNCSQGCNMGPASLTGGESLDKVENRVEQRRAELQAEARRLRKNQDASELQTLEEAIEEYWDGPRYQREYRDRRDQFALRAPSPQEREAILHRMHKHSEADIHNCSSCGYERCDSMVLAIHNGLNRVENCHHYLIAERASSQAIIEQSEQRLVSILDTSLDGFIQVDLDGRVEDVNEAMLTMLGQPREALIGTFLRDLLDEHSAATIKEQLALRTRGQTSRYEIDLTQPSGDTLHCLCHGSPMYGADDALVGSFAMVTDITEFRRTQAELAQHRDNLEDMVQERTQSLETEIECRRNAEHDLRAHEQQLRAIFDRTPLAVVLVDCETRAIVEANTVALKTIGAPRERVVGERCSLICPARSDACPVLDCGERVENDERTLLRADGSDPLPILKTVVPIRLGGRDCLLESIVDITDQKRTQAALEEAKEAAESNSRAKSDFLANMSHEIRTPMNALIGLTYLALKTDLSPKQRDYLTKIQTSSESLLGIINSILDFSKIEAGKIELEAVPFELEDITRQLLDVFGQDAQDKGLTLVFDFPGDVPGSLVGDPLRLHQVLTNLVANALKFTAEGTVAITVTVAHRSADQVVLEFAVSDTGIGIAADQVDGIFEVFNQADGSTTRRFGGTGLGLSICQRLVKLMGGDMRVQSKVGEGSLFAFTARFALPAAEPTAPKPLEPGLRNLRALVIDGQNGESVLRRQLESLSFRVTGADSVVEALTAIEQAASSDPYQLVVVEWSLMEGPGAAAFADTRSLPTAPRIVVTSSIWSEALSRNVDDPRVDGFLPQPFTCSTLHDKVSALFARRIAATADRREEGTPDLTGVRVLLAEDNEINREVALGLLAETGCQTTVAMNGCEAVNAAEVARFDFILMDVQMPVMDGHEATRRIRALESASGLPRTPVFAMTAGAMTEDRQMALDAGMDTHIAKPIDPDELFGAIASWGGRKSKPAVDRIDADLQPPDASVLDTVAALARLSGKQALYQRLLQKFSDEFESCGDEIGAALSIGHVDDARRLAHTIKGVAGNLGAEQLQQAAYQLESAIRDGDDPAAHLDRFQASLSAAMTAVLAAAADAEPTVEPDPTRPPGELPKLMTMLGELRPFLEHNRPQGARQILDAIVRWTWPHPIAVQIDELEKALAAYRFDAANAALNSLQATLEQESGVIA